jgi:hypothetical protein
MKMVQSNFTYIASIIKLIRMKASSEPKKKNYTVLGTIVGVLFIGIAYFAIQQKFFKEPTYDMVLMEAASELNKSCPMMVDEITRLDNAVALPTNEFQYNYSLVGLTIAEINVDTLVKYIEPGVINNVKNNPDLKFYRDNNTTLTYIYRDKNGELVHQFSVTPEEYTIK